MRLLKLLVLKDSQITQGELNLVGEIRNLILDISLSNISVLCSLNHMNFNGMHLIIDELVSQVI